MACTFSTSELPREFWTWCILCILTSKCASCQNCAHFFSISTSKNGPTMTMVCFVHFDFEMCNAPQRHAIFHLSFGQMAPRWPLERAYFSTARSHITLENTVSRDFSTFSRAGIFFPLTLSLLWSSLFCSSLFWLCPRLLFHLSILSEVWLLNFLRLWYSTAKMHQNSASCKLI